MDLNFLQQETFKAFGAFALCLIFLMVALVWVTRQWVAALSTIKEMHAARLSDVKDQAKVGEAMRDTMADITVALQANTKIMETVVARERDR